MKTQPTLSTLMLCQSIGSPSQNLYMAPGTTSMRLEDGLVYSLDILSLASLMILLDF